MTLERRRCTARLPTAANPTRMQLNDTESKTALAEKEISVVEKVELPVYEEDLFPEKSIRCVQIYKRMLSLLTSGPKCCVLCYACLQLLCTWNAPAAMESISSVLRCEVCFKGLPLQQLLDDFIYMSCAHVHHHSPVLVQAEHASREGQL